MQIQKIEERFSRDVAEVTLTGSDKSLEKAKVLIDQLMEYADSRNNFSDAGNNYESKRKDHFHGPSFDNRGSFPRWGQTRHETNIDEGQSGSSQFERGVRKSSFRNGGDSQELEVDNSPETISRNSGFDQEQGTSDTECDWSKMSLNRNDEMGYLDSEVKPKIDWDKVNQVHVRYYLTILYVNV